MLEDKMKQDIKPIDIVRAFGVSDSLINTIFDDKKKVSISDVEFLCNFFNIDIDDYFNNQKEKYIDGNYNYSGNKALKFDLEVFADNFKTLRELKGYSQQQVADKIYCDIRTIQYYESAGRTPTVDRLMEIASFFNVPVSYLLNK